MQVFCVCDACSEIVHVVQSPTLYHGTKSTGVDTGKS